MTSSTSGLTKLLTPLRRVRAKKSSENPADVALAEDLNFPIGVLADVEQRRTLCAELAHVVTHFPPSGLTQLAYVLRDIRQTLERASANTKDVAQQDNSRTQEELPPMHADDLRHAALSAPTLRRYILNYVFTESVFWWHTTIPRSSLSVQQQHIILQESPGFLACYPQLFDDALALTAAELRYPGLCAAAQAVHLLHDSRVAQLFAMEDWLTTATAKANAWPLPPTVSLLD